MVGRGGCFFRRFVFNDESRAALVGQKGPDPLEKDAYPHERGDRQHVCELSCGQSIQIRSTRLCLNATDGGFINVIDLQYCGCLSSQLLAKSSILDKGLTI